MPQKIDKIYDRIFKRMMTLSSELIVALINSLFGTSYPPDSTLIYNLTENINNQLNRTIADTIITINNVHSYHLEAQVYEDDNIIFRMFDYGYQQTLEQLKNLIFNDIIAIINKQLAAGILTIADATMLREFLLKLYNHLYTDYEECEEGGFNAMVEDEIIFQTDIIIAEVTERVTKELSEKYIRKLADKDKIIEDKDRIILAYQLLSKNTPVEQVVDETGLTEDIIRNL